MKVVYTVEALHDLDEILTFLAVNYPTILTAFEMRLAAVLRRVGSWPLSAEEVEQRPGIHVAPLIRYPYKVFYQVANETVEILHIHHAARQEPWR